MPDSTHAAPPSFLEVGAIPAGKLVSEFAELLNRYGTDSTEAQAYLESRGQNEEFAELARLSITLKRALSIGRTVSKPPT